MAVGGDSGGPFPLGATALRLHRGHPPAILPSCRTCSGIPLAEHAAFVFRATAPAAPWIPEQVRDDEIYGAAASPLLTATKPSTANHCRSRTPSPTERAARPKAVSAHRHRRVTAPRRDHARSNEAPAGQPGDRRPRAGHRSAILSSA